MAWDSSTPKRITNLDICEQNLTGALDVGCLTSLLYLSCNSNELTGMLNVSGLTNLKVLSCSSNRLTELTGLSDLTSLTSLYCDANQLASLKLSDSLVLTVPAVTGGTVMLTGYTHSTKAVELTATADSGYTFEKWTKDGATPTDIIDNPVTIILDEAITLTPVYTSALTGTVEISGTLSAPSKGHCV